MKTDPSDPHDLRRPSEPIIETMEIAMDGGGINAHARIIEQALTDFLGIQAVEIELGDALARITYDARLTNPAAIHEAILNAGYQPGGMTD